MAEYAGSAVVIIFNGTAGSLSLKGDCRNCTITPALSKIDCTAGQDTSKQFIESFTDWTVSWSGVAQNGTTGAQFGTILKPGIIGTLDVYPYGSASGAGTFLKYSMVAMCGGAVVAMPYADVVTLSVDFGPSSGGTMVVGTAAT